MENVTLVCVLRAGGDFRPRHVQWLAKQVPGLVCLSDQPVAGVETRPLHTDWPGWWAKMEAFGPSVQGNMLLIDLDTVVLKLPTLPTETTVLTDFTRPHLIGSGFMYVTEADRARVWEAFTDDSKRHIAQHQRIGDQGFLLEHLKDAVRWGANIASYKVHCRKGVPDGTDVVCFHGKPRPWDVPDSWIPSITGNDFRGMILGLKGKRICVMGGAPSLEDDLKKINADIYISANAHGAQIQKPDYILAMDEIHSGTKEPMGEYLRQRSDALIISPHAYGDIRLGQWPQHPRWVLTGLVSTWAAFVMGARVVYLAGFDAYNGDPDYIHEARKIARDVKCPVRVASGPLTEIWPAIDPAEKFGRYTPHSAIDGWLQKDGRISIRVIKSCPVNGIRTAPGDILPVWRHEVHKLIRHRMVEEV